MDMTVRVQRADEELYRNAATLITETVGNYASIYKGQKSEKEILCMALVDIALRFGREARRNETKPYSDVVKQLTKEIDTALGKS